MSFAANQGGRTVSKEDRISLEQVGGPARPVHFTPEAQGWSKFMCIC